MTLGVTTTLHCDGCSGGESLFVTSWSLDGGPTGSRSWKSTATPKSAGLKAVPQVQDEAPPRLLPGVREGRWGGIGRLEKILG